MLTDGEIIRVSELKNNRAKSWIIILTKDKELKQRWDTMREALMSGDLEDALDLFSFRTKERYRLMFEGLSEELPSLFLQYGDIQMVSLIEDGAELEIPVNKGGRMHYYPLTFRQNADGFWKIEQF